jgi:hypothetical protein
VKPDEVGPFHGQQFVEPLLNFFLSFFSLVCETLKNSAPPTGWLAGQLMPMILLFITGGLLYRPTLPMQHLKPSPCGTRRPAAS